MENTQTMSVAQSDGLRSFFGKIYGKMATGLLLTAITAFAMVGTDIGIMVMQKIFGSQILYYGVVGIQIALVFGIQWAINKISKKVANFLFYLYSILSGATLSVILIAYTGSTLVSALVAAFAVFATLATIGKTMKYDMSGWRVFLYTGMWGVFIASILNIFLASSRLDWIVTIVSVLVFSGLTVYDVQYYKKIYQSNEQGGDLSKVITIGALHMYLNFIMIFVNLLKIIGRD